MASLHNDTFERHFKQSELNNSREHGKAEWFFLGTFISMFVERF